jgi:hypothetical protein
MSVGMERLYMAAEAGRYEALGDVVGEWEAR